MRSAPSADEQLTFEPAGQDPLWAAATAQAHRALGQVRTDIHRRQEIQSILVRLNSAMSSGNVDAAARIISDPRARAATDLFPELRKPMENVRLAVDASASGRLGDLLKRVEEYAKEQGWTVRRSKDSIRIGHLVAVTPNPAGQTKVQSKSVRSLSFDAVRPVLDAEYERVWGRAQRLGAAEIARQFGDVVDSAGTETGTDRYVRLKYVYGRVKALRPKEPGRIASYYRDEFSADISVMKKDDATARAFEFAAARDPNLAFEVVEPDGSLLQYGYVRRR